MVARSNDLEWVDPVVGARMRRHLTSSGSEFNLEGDVGGFGAGSEFACTDAFPPNRMRRARTEAQKQADRREAI